MYLEIYLLDVVIFRYGWEPLAPGILVSSKKLYKWCLIIENLSLLNSDNVVS